MNTAHSNTQLTSEVLFQKMGNTWYVFTENSGDMIYSALPYGMSPHTTNLELFEVIEEHLAKVSRHYSRKPEMVAQSMSALKKPDCEVSPTLKKKFKTTYSNDDMTQKAETERMNKQITEKIKDPALARKAAMLITEMLDKKI